MGWAGSVSMRKVGNSRRVRTDFEQLLHNYFPPWFRQARTVFAYFWIIIFRFQRFVVTFVHYIAKTGSRWASWPTSCRLDLARWLCCSPAYLRAYWLWSAARRSVNNWIPSNFCTNCTDFDHKKYHFQHLRMYVLKKIISSQYLKFFNIFSFFDLILQFFYKAKKRNNITFL